jgi:beta-lactamase superfamily II metal-dependent hydrolase
MFKKQRAKYLVAILLIFMVSLTLSGCPDPSGQQPEPPGTADQQPEPPDIADPQPEPPNTEDPQPEPTEPIDQPSSAASAVTAWVFDVGEALSLFIDVGDTEVLIDAGYDKDGKRITEFIGDYISDNTLEYAIATHSHQDHVGGFEDIYDAYHVAHTIYGDTGTTAAFNQFIGAAESEENSSVNEDTDETIQLADGVTLYIMDILDGDDNTNNNSVISVLDCNGKKMLVTGDYEDAIKENKAAYYHERLTSGLLESGLYPIDVYIVGHHGSETSSSSELLALINPAYAVISSASPDYRKYENPDITVMERLTEIGARIYATYRSKDIRIDFQRGEILVSPPDSELLTPENYKEAA